LARDFHGRWNERRFSGFMVQIGLEKFSPCSFLAGRGSPRANGIALRGRFANLWGVASR
jgi:hypothetical protein